jgi:transcriptional regulator
LTYPAETKQKALELLKKGVKQNKIAMELNIPEDTVSRWKKEFLIVNSESYRDWVYSLSLKSIRGFLLGKNRKFFDQLYRQYQDKGIALRYAQVILLAPGMQNKLTGI